MNGIGSNVAGGAPRLLLQRNVQLLWVGRFFSQLGDQLHEIALILLMWQATQSSLLTAVATFATRAPFWLFGLLGGIWGDRLPRRKLIVRCNIAGAILAATVVLAWPALGAAPALVITVAFGIGLCRALEVPAVCAQLPDLAANADSRQINGVLDNTKRIARLFGPLLINAIKPLASAVMLYTATAVCYLIMALTALQFRIPKERMEPAADRGLAHDLRSAWLAGRKTPPIGRAISFSGVYCIGHACCYWVCLPRLVLDAFQGGAQAYAAAVAGIAAGGLIGNILVTMVRAGAPELRLALGMGLAGLSFVAMAFAPDTNMLMVLGVGIGLALPLQDVSVQVIVHELGPKDHWARLFAAWRYVAEAGIGIGLLLGGLLVDAIGPNWAIGLAGTGMFATAIALVLFRIHARRAAPQPSAAPIGRLTACPATTAKLGEDQ